MLTLDQSSFMNYFEQQLAFGVIVESEAPESV